MGANTFPVFSLPQFEQVLGKPDKEVGSYVLGMVQSASHK